MSRALFLLFITACASAPKAPEWTTQSARTVDNGYIVYLGTGEANNIDRAQFKAEGQALEDLANECSLIPQGTRIEDRYAEKSEHEVKAYVKLAVEFQECDLARHANDPGQIRKVASVAFTQQLKRYQDLIETGDMPEADASRNVTPPTDVAAAPARADWSETTHFYVTRQYVAYQKEIVVLAPASTYAPGTPAAKQFAANVQPTAEQVLHVEEKQPSLRQQVWSKVPDHPMLPRPPSLASKPNASHAVRPLAPQGYNPPQRTSGRKKARGGRRHRFN